MLDKQQLLHLAPSPIDGPGPDGPTRRRGLGIELRCPRHGDAQHEQSWGIGHRIRLWFRHPEDGGEPQEGQRLYHHIGTLKDLRFFSVYNVEGYPLRAPMHWEGYVVEGCVWDALRFASL